MKKKIILILILLSTLVNVNGQNLETLNYSWDDKINIPKESLGEELIVSVKEKYIEEFYFDKKDFLQNSLTHKLIWLNSDKSIEDYNKIYLPFNSSSELLLSKARVIKANGLVVELSKDEILTAKDEETKKEYRYYAVKGLEKGSFIEYFYIIKKRAIYKGTRLVLQSDYKKKNISFELIAPENLIFDFKSKGLANIKKDTTQTEKNKWFLKNISMDELKYEEMSPYLALKKSLTYKLDKNLYSPGNGITSYDNFSQDVYNLYYDNVVSDDLKLVKKIIKKLKLSSFEKEDAVRVLENYIKNTFYILKSNGIRSFDEIFDKKNANEYEVLKFLIQAFETLGIKTEIVATCNRYDNKFDSEFESENYLQTYLIYFPELKKYLSPTGAFERLGFPMFSYMGNLGLFIRKITVNNFSTGIGEVKEIKALPAESSIAKMDIEVSFNEDVNSSDIHFKRSFSGFKAYGYQPYLNLLTDDKKKKLYESLLKMYGDDVSILDYRVENDKSEMYGVSPLVIDGHLKYDGFLTKAGNKIVFNIGGLIGPQAEMYQISERKLPYENYFNRIYSREIKINIPEGYKVSNLEDINMNVVSSVKGENTHGFVSTYTVENNQILIKINEYYKNIFISLDDFESFRKVVNAAADFNKINLFFSK